jgi:hypothetical protein
MSITPEGARESRRDQQAPDNIKYDQVYTFGCTIVLRSVMDNQFLDSTRIVEMGTEILACKFAATVRMDTLDGDAMLSEQVGLVADVLCKSFVLGPQKWFLEPTSCIVKHGEGVAMMIYRLYGRRTP